MAAATRKGVDPGLGIAAAAVYRKSVLAVGNGTVAEKNTYISCPCGWKIGCSDSYGSCTGVPALVASYNDRWVWVA